MTIKIFSDGADFNSMIEMAQNPLIEGLTTNPTLMKKAGITNYQKFAKDVLAKVKDKPISFEVFSDEFPEMERQALEINSWGKNVYVKIPITNSKMESSQKLIRSLSERGVKLNVTAILTLSQVVQTCKSVENGESAIISVFAGRIADTGVDPVPLMQAAKEICGSYGDHIELLWASSREVLNIKHAETAGCDIITITNDLLGKYLKLRNKDLTALSLETVHMFKTDAEAAGYVL